MYAMLVTVKLDAARADEADRALHEITVPAVRSHDGFVRGLWLRDPDKSRGRGVVVFESEQHATAAADGIRQQPPSDTPVTVESVEIFEVAAEA